MKYRYQSVAAIIVVLFVLLQLATVWNGGVNGVFNSPDESANYHFARRVYERKPVPVESLYRPSPASAYLAPRSARVINRSVVPVGFSGLILLYGFVSRVFFVDVISYVSVFLSAVALYCLYRLMLRTGPSEIALLALALLSINPAWWYYTNTSLYPNVAFVSFLLLSVYAAFESRMSVRGRVWLSSAALAIALLIRPSEALWVIPCVTIALFKFKNKLDMRTVLFAAGIVLGTIVAGWSLGAAVTAQPGGIGYHIAAAEGRNGFGSLYSYVFPFGFHPRLVVAHAREYLLMMFAPFSVLSAAGIAHALATRSAKIWRWYAGMFAFGSAIIIVFYGSWLIRDSTGPESVTIGTSYVRYFLPVFVGAVPYAAHAMYAAVQSRPRSLRASFYALMLLLFALFSFRSVFLDPHEGILAKRKTLENYDEVAAYLLAETSPSTIVVTDHGDKFVWPHREVMRIPKNRDDVQALGYLMNEEFAPAVLVSRTLTPDEVLNVRSRLSGKMVGLGSELASFRNISVYKLYVSTEKNPD